MDDNKRVWVPHETDGFKLGRIIDIGSDTISVEPSDTPGQVISNKTIAIQISYICCIYIYINIYKHCNILFIYCILHIKCLV